MVGPSKKDISAASQMLLSSVTVHLSLFLLLSRFFMDFLRPICRPCFILQITSCCPHYEVCNTVNVRYPSVHLHYGILFPILLKMQLPFRPLNLP